MLGKIEKLAGPVAVVVAGVMLAGYLMSSFSTNSYVAKAQAGYRS